MQNLQSSYPVIVELGDVKDTKLKLVKVIVQLISKRYKTQKEAADALKIDQPKISQINRSRIEGFSLEYLLNLLIALGQDINVRIKHNPKPA